MLRLPVTQTYRTFFGFWFNFSY